MSDYRPPVGTDYISREKAAFEDRYTLAAADAAKAGKSFDEFLATDFDYRTMCNDQQHRADYARMRKNVSMDKVRGTETFDPLKELSAVRQKRYQRYDAERKAEQYMQLRDVLLQYASDCQPWSVVRRELGDRLVPDCEEFYKQARREAGTANEPDKTDPWDEAMRSGFCGG